jgi:N4-bis(aminopropyl)spermidine synthase
MKSQFNLREALNAISDVVNNRPRALREFDQIFMKTADMLLQSEHVSRHVNDKKLVCIGDGDAIGLCLMQLHNRKILNQGPKSLHVLDFDERVVYSVQRFAEKHNLQDKISSELYNVAEPLPKKHWQNFDGFYTNPPFGASNDGVSVKAFIQRGMEAIGNDGIGCVVIADDKEHQWSQTVLRNVQNSVIEDGFLVVEMIPAFHTYHLDDSPDLTSCSLIFRRQGNIINKSYDSRPLPKEQFKDFYGENKSLKIKYVRDLTKGGTEPSKDHKFELIEGDNL